MGVLCLWLWTILTVWKQSYAKEPCEHRKWWEENGETKSITLPSWSWETSDYATIAAYPRLYYTEYCFTCIVLTLKITSPAHTHTHPYHWVCYINYLSHSHTHTHTCAHTHAHTTHDACVHVHKHTHTHTQACAHNGSMHTSLSLFFRCCTRAWHYANRFSFMYVYSSQTL